MANTNKIALVTGGSRGLGKEMALRIADKGLDVVLTYHSKADEAAAVAEQIRAMGRKAEVLQLDVSQSTALDSFAQELEKTLNERFDGRKLYFLVNNAGIGIHAPFGQTSADQLDQLFNIHFKSPYLLTQLLLPVVNDGGGIVNISTGLARFALPGYSAYASMKGAMEVLTRYQAKELGARGIRSNIVAPGAIETDFSGGVVRDNAQMNAAVAGHTALGRVGLPDDIGGVVAFLCTGDARWVNAQRIEVSGGMYV